MRDNTFEQADMDHLRDLVAYLGGLRDLLATNMICDNVTIDRQYLHSLIEPAFDKAERVYCDLMERQARRGEESEATPQTK